MVAHVTLLVAPHDIDLAENDFKKCFKCFKTSILPGMLRHNAMIRLIVGSGLKRRCEVSIPDGDRALLIDIIEF